MGKNTKNSAKRIKKKKKAVKRSWNFPSQQSQGEHQAKC